MKKLFLIICIVSSFLYSCEKEDKDPGVSMISAVALSASSGKAVAKIDQKGDYTITDHGFVFAASSSSSVSNPGINNVDPSNKVSLGSIIKADTFSAILPLTSSDGYYYGSNYRWNVWAYITNEKGTVYSTTPISFYPKQLVLQSVSPTVGKVGDTLTISGSNFDTSISNIQVRFYNYYESNYVLANVISATETTLKVIVPSISETSSYYSSNYQFSIKVKMGNNEMTLSNSFSLTPVPTGFSPKQGSFNTYITISGTQMESISSVIFGNESTYVSGRSNTAITFYVPSSAKQKRSKIYVVKGGTQIEVPGGEFEILPLTVSSVSPLKVWPGNSVTITGSNFNNSSSYNIILIGSSRISASYESSSSISFGIPYNMPDGEYAVRISNGIDTVLAPGVLRVVVPSITAISPSSAYPGDLITITGHNFNDNNYVYIDGYSYYSSEHDSVSYKLTVPALAPGRHNIQVYANGYYAQSTKEFIVIEPTISSITPTSGAIGTSFVINGKGFGKNTYDVGVMFGNVNASVLSVSDTQINAKVPANTGSGTWVVSVTVNGNKISDTAQFTIP
ncbi:MAG TPA: IPT/TIG domain-containing protein [Bacteroidales bacterium]|nr:IPT/TIG domain-containing protein [Bacteroidales bacterium]